jgi:hypothetical protein
MEKNDQTPTCIIDMARWLTNKIPRGSPPPTIGRHQQRAFTPRPLRPARLAAPVAPGMLCARWSARFAPSPRRRPGSRQSVPCPPLSPRHSRGRIECRIRPPGRHCRAFPLCYLFWPCAPIMATAVALSSGLSCLKIARPIVCAPLRPSTIIVSVGSDAI